MRHVIRSLGALSVMLCCAASVWAGDTVVFKIMAVNPSDSETQKVPLKAYLPQEVKPEHVVDAGTLKVEYDAEQGAYYVTEDVELKPGESVMRQIELEDIWVIPDEELQQFFAQVKAIVRRAEGTTYAEQVNFQAGGMEFKLNQVAARQHEASVPPQEHISQYRQDRKTLKDLEAQLAALERLVAGAPPATGPTASVQKIPGPEQEVTASKGAISVATTWKLMFAVIGFLALISVVFVMVWMKQAGTTETQNTRTEKQEETAAAQKPAEPAERTEEAQPGESPVNLEDLEKLLNEDDDKQAS